MASIFTIVGTVTSIGDLRQSRSGKNYIRLELRANGDELLPLIAFERVAKKVIKEVKLGSHALVAGTVHGTNENVNSRYIDISLFVDNITNLDKESYSENKTKPTVNNTTSNSYSANSQNAGVQQNSGVQNRVQTELAQKEKEIQQKKVVNQQGLQNTESVSSEPKNNIAKDNKNSIITDDSTETNTSNSNRDNRVNGNGTASSSQNTTPPDAPSNDEDDFNFDFDDNENDSFFN